MVVILCALKLMYSFVQQIEPSAVSMVRGGKGGVLLLRLEKKRSGRAEQTAALTQGLNQGRGCGEMTTSRYPSLPLLVIQTTRQHGRYSVFVPFFAVVFTPCPPSPPLQAKHPSRSSTLASNAQAALDIFLTRLVVSHGSENEGAFTTGPLVPLQLGDLKAEVRKKHPRSAVGCVRPLGTGCAPSVASAA